MPLSEHEQRLLDQMERALSAEDPKLANALRGRVVSRHRRRAVALAVAGFVVGAAMLLVGVVWPRLVAVSVAGFVLMLVSVVGGVNGWRTRAPALRVVDPYQPGRRVSVGGREQSIRPQPGRYPAGRPERPRRPAVRGSFMQRVEQRWQRRRSDRGF